MPVRSKPVEPHMRLRALAIVAGLLTQAGVTTATAYEGPAPSPFEATAEMKARLGELPRGTEAKMQAIVELIFDKEDGLGFTYRRRPTLTGAEAFEERAGNCLSLVNLFVALGRSAGLKAHFVEVEDYEVFYRDDGVVVRSDHIVGGVRVGGELLTIDFLPGQAKSYYELRSISDARAMAHYYKAIATEALIDDDLDTAERWFDVALEIDPDFAATWNNVAILKRRQDDFSGAFVALERALELEPELLSALENLSGLYRRTGQHDEAEEVNARLLQLQTQNPFFLVAEAERMLEVRDVAAAEQMLQRARRLEPDLPEIYLHLARIQFDRGEPRKARRLLNKARTKSELFSQRVQEVVNDKISTLVSGRGSGSG